MANDVDTMYLLAQWHISDFKVSCRQSELFKIGAWHWDLFLHNDFVRLTPKIREGCLLSASFNMRIISLIEGRETLVHTEIRDNQFKSSKGYIWTLGVSLPSRFIIEVEFLDLKTASRNGGEPRSIWSEGFTVKQKAKAMSAFGRLLSESMHIDIIIWASDGSIGAHRAILAARSPVFDRMFTQDLKEKDLSSINIPDMSIEVCQAFLSYIYSNSIQYQDFLTHRFDILRASDKYDIADLKDACQENLIEDIDSKIVLGVEPRSIWSERCMQNVTGTSILSRMLSESIHTDIIILTSDGRIGAHRAVLAARSPVFDSMFTHDLKEKDSSSINIPDMSIVVCQAFLSYLYSNNVQSQELLTHRLDLLRAADKYDVSDLKDACQESLIEDLNSKNVLERLQVASMYRAPRLKACCIQYLVNFGKIFDIKEEFKAFVQSADKELVSEVVDEIISTWNGV